MSESAVDSFLLSHLKDYMESLPNGVQLHFDKIFSLDSRQAALNAVDEIKKFVPITQTRTMRYSDDEEDGIKLHDDPRFMGVTEAINTFGSFRDPNAPIVTPFDEENWKNNKINELVTIGKSVEEATKIATDIIGTWKQLTQWGDDVHLIMETIFKGGTEIPKTSLGSKIALDVWNSGIELKRQLIEKYGKDARFFPELNIKAKELRSDIQTLLESNGHEFLSGTLDLLVIDEHGAPHIIDYKVSRKSVGIWNVRDNERISPEEWSSAKKYNIENQQAAYRRMLAQYGLRDATTEIIPFKLDITYTDEYKSGIASLNSVTRLERIPLIKGTQTGTTAQNWASILPTDSKIIPKEFESILRKHEILLPRTSTQRLVVQQYEASIEHARQLIKTVSEGTKEYNEGKRFYFYDSQQKKMIYRATKEEIDEALEKYVDSINDFKANELLSLGHNIVRVMQGDLTLNELKSSFSTSVQSFVEYQFKKYINQKWTLRSSDELLAAGIFIFSLDGKIEVITMSNESLGTTYNLGMGTSILGKTKENAYINKKKIMDATVGNIEIMKAMLFIAENQDLFKDNQIVQVKCINPWMGQESTELNSVILDNFEQLIASNDTDEEFKKIDRKLFKGDVPALLRLAEDKLMLVLDNGFAGLGLDDAKFSGEFNEIAKDDIAELITKLEKNFTFLRASETSMQGDEDIWLCYWYLKQAYLAMSDMRIYNETDPGAWLANNGFKMGLYINSGEFSPSTNIRQLSDIISMFASEVRIEVDRIGREVKHAFEEFFKDMGHNNIMGRKADWYKLLFVTDENGNITEEFRLKDPNDPSVAGKPAGKLIDAWLRTMAKLRWPNATEGQIESLKQLGTYYQVPLTEAAFSRQIKGVGLFKAFKNKIAQYSELTHDVFAGEGMEKENWNKEHDRMYNKLDQTPERRLRLMKDHGVGFFEYDLEAIINQSLVSFTKTNISKKYIPTISAMKTAMRASQTYGGKSLKTTTEVFDKMVKSKFYGENIIEGEGLQRFARWINVIKRGLSTLQLGFNERSFVRESLQGNWMAMTRSGIKPINGLTFDTYTKAATFIIQEAHKNFSSTSMLQQLNAIYGMANQSLGQIAGQRKLHWSGIRNFNKDTVFLNTTAPDFQHRMAILVGKMMGDGCWEAHSLNENGDLVYDWTKDKRFEVYARSLTDKSAESDPKYLEQKMLYMTHISELQKAGFKKEDGTDYKVGDALPRAYLPKENQGIKNYADLLFGHYDEETKSLVSDMFLGSLFMQYKTYVTSRAEQWGLDGGVYNTETMQWVEDPITHEKLYKVHQEQLSDSGQPIIELKTKSQIENFDELVEKGLIEPYYEYVGIPMEGMGRSMVRFFGKVAKMDWKGAMEMWKNPIDRDNFILGLNDCLIMSLLMLITTGLFGLMLDGEWITDSQKIAQHARKAGWGESFSYQVIYGSFQDFPVTQVVGTMFNDWNPSSWVAAKRLISNSSSVILGDKTIAQAATRSIGALSDFRGIADNLAK